MAIRKQDSPWYCPRCDVEHPTDDMLDFCRERMAEDERRLKSQTQTPTHQRSK